MTTSAATSNAVLSARQNQLISILEKAGVSWVSFLGQKSVNSFRKNNGSGQVVIELTADVDIKSFLNGITIEGIAIRETVADSGFETPKYPIYRIAFGADNSANAQYNQ